MTAPLRIERKRVKGWRKPANTVCVTRPGRWGNSFVVGEQYVRRRMAPGGGENSNTIMDAEHAVRLYARYTARETIYQIEAYRELRGKNLACFCALCEAHAAGRALGIQCVACDPCHVDILLPLANKEAA